MIETIQEKHRKFIKYEVKIKFTKEGMEAFSKLKENEFA